MIEAKISGIDACVFDAYGTLFDVRSAAERSREVLGEKTDPLAELWRRKQLEYTWLRTLMGRHADFWRVTRDALDYAMESLDVGDTELKSRLMDLYLTLDAYPEVPDTLSRLKAAGLRTAILSNGSPAMLEAAVTKAGIGSLLDRVLSVESVGVFKPHPAVYRLAADDLGLPPERIAFHSANAWDVAGAAAFGCIAVWINRQCAPVERLPGTAAATLPSLAGLPALLRR